MHASKGTLGRIGEDAAAAHYGAAGYQVLSRNWRCGLGELDLVLRSGDTIVFCEVKTRRSAAYGGPFDAVTVSKQRKLRQLAEAYLAAVLSDPAQVRFDVASVMVASGERPSVHVYRDAF